MHIAIARPYAPRSGKGGQTTNSDDAIKYRQAIFRYTVLICYNTCRQFLRTPLLFYQRPY